MTLSKEQIAASLTEADELYEQHLEELAAEDRGEEVPPLDPATLSMPNLAKSKVINVRVMDSDHAALTALAAERGIAVSDIVRAAIRRYIHDDASMVADLVNALRDAGLELIHTRPASHQ